MVDGLRKAGVTPVSPLLVRGFGLIARRRMRGAFGGVRVLHAERVQGLARGWGVVQADGSWATGTAGAADAGPVVVYLNHPSWWDPLFCLVLAERLMPGRAHYAPMSAASLKLYPMFKRLGMFGVEQGASARGAVQFLRGSQAILQSGSVLWVTAQGAFTDVRVRPAALKAGLGALVARNERITLIPLALEYTFWDERLPEALAAVGEPMVLEGRSRQAEAWTPVLEHALETVQDELKEVALRRTSEHFLTLLDGNRAFLACMERGSG